MEKYPAESLVAREVRLSLKLAQKLSVLQRNLLLEELMLGTANVHVQKVRSYQ